MQFNVAQLLKEPIGATRTYQLDENLTGLDPELIALSPLTGTLQLLRTHSGVLGTGRFDVTVQMDCGRCLEPIAAQVEAIFEESFRPLTEVTTGRYLLPDEFEGEEEELEDSALIIDERHILDISEVLRQSIWLCADDPPLSVCPAGGVSEFCRTAVRNGRERRRSGGRRRPARSRPPLGRAAGSAEKQR